MLQHHPVVLEKCIEDAKTGFIVTGFDNGARSVACLGASLDAHLIFGRFGIGLGNWVAGCGDWDCGVCHNTDRS